MQSRPLETWLPDDGVGADVLVVAGVHGEEPETTVLLSSALRTVAPGRLAVAVVLAANPDGLARGTRGNANDVDLNRNFPDGAWSPSPVFHRFTRVEPQDVRLSPGTHPGSEPEVGALVALVARLAPRFVVSIHAPLAYVGDNRLSPLGRQIAAGTGLPLVPHPNPIPGSLDSWTRAGGIGSITVELPVISKDHALRRHLAPMVQLLETRLEPAPAPEGGSPPLASRSARDADQDRGQIAGHTSGSA